MSPILRKRHAEHLERDGHFSSTLHELDVSDKGYFAVETCTSCGFLHLAECLHAVNKWNEEGTELRCQLCNADVT